MPHRIYEIPSTGKKWYIPSKIFSNVLERVRCDGTTAICILHLPTLDIWVHIEPGVDHPWYTCEGVGGYIGLSKHADGYHLGTPAFALSLPLCRAMEVLI